MGNFGDSTKPSMLTGQLNPPKQIKKMGNIKLATPKVKKYPVHPTAMEDPPKTRVDIMNISRQYG